MAQPPGHRPHAPAPTSTWLPGPAAVRGRAAHGPHAAGTASGSRGPGFLSKLSPAAPRTGPGRTGCCRGDGGHGQLASLCPGLVSDFTLSQGPHVSCVRLSGDESPGARRMEATSGPHGQPPLAPAPACKCPEGPACSRDLRFLQTSSFLFPGQEGDPSLNG